LYRWRKLLTCPYSSPSIEGDRLIYLTMETKIKPHTAGTISKSNVKIKVTSKEKKIIKRERR
jgi:hypothetical protein